jgi:hypothetical protein
MTISLFKLSGQMHLPDIRPYLENGKCTVFPVTSAKLVAILYEEFKSDPKVTKKDVLRYLKLAEKLGKKECGVTSQKNT